MPDARPGTLSQPSSGEWRPRSVRVSVTRAPLLGPHATQALARPGSVGIPHPREYSKAMRIERRHCVVYPESSGVAAK